jgi:hypothetical protein
MTPLPEHEVNKEYLSDFVKVLLEELDIEFCPLGSSTFKNQIRYEKNKLQILLLVDGKYVESEASLNFPDFSLIDTIPHYLNQCRTEGRNKGMRAFRSWVQEHLQ